METHINVHQSIFYIPSFPLFCFINPALNRKWDRLAVVFCKKQTMVQKKSVYTEHKNHTKSKKEKHRQRHVRMYVVSRFGA
jgi:hypothetical protein